jgi:ABC-type sugar transport system ATPase subunit
VRLFEFLQETKQVCPMILITHDLYDAVRLCDRIVVLKRGNVVYNSKIEGMGQEEAFQEIIKQF